LKKTVLFARSSKARGVKGEIKTIFPFREAPGLWPGSFTGAIGDE